MYRIRRERKKEQTIPSPLGKRCPRRSNMTKLKLCTGSIATAGRRNYGAQYINNAYKHINKN